MNIMDSIHRGYTNPLKIMYDVGLNPEPFWSQISRLEELGYVNDLYRNSNLTMLTITKKGYDILDIYKKALELVSIQFHN